MINLFLKAKHWQLFSLTFGIPVVIQFVMVGTMLANFNESGPLVMFKYLKFFTSVMILSTGILFLWYWSVVEGLRKKVPAQISLKVKKFRVFFFIPVVYILFLFLWMNLMIGSLINLQDEPPIGFILSLVAIFMPLHFFSMFCIFYSLYFVAKIVKTVELQREVSFSDFVGEFFLLCFYPIGVWIVQPKINAMIHN
jgi:hypothetical protein